MKKLLLIILSVLSISSLAESAYRCLTLPEVHISRFDNSCREVLGTDKFDCNNLPKRYFTIYVR